MKQLDVKDVSDLSFLATRVRILAQKLPQDSKERALLVDVENAFTAVKDFHRCLEDTQKQIDVIRALPLPEDYDVVWSKIAFEDLAKQFAEQFGEQSKVATSLKRSSEILGIWHQWYSSVKKLLVVSAAFRTGMARQEDGA